MKKRSIEWKPVKPKPISPRPSITKVTPGGRTPAKPKSQLFLGVYDVSPGYVDGKTSIGLYDGATEEEAKSKMIDAILKPWGDSPPHGYRVELDRSIQMTPLNGPPLEIVHKPTNYRG